MATTTTASLDSATQLVSSWVDIQYNQLSQPENSLVKTVVDLYAQKLVTGGDRELLKQEFCCLFNSTLGMYAIDLAQNASHSASELARNTGMALGETLREQMRTQFNAGLREGMNRGQSSTSDLVSPGKFQVDNYFAKRKQPIPIRLPDKAA